MCSSAMPPGKEFGTYLSKYVHDVANSPSVEPSLQMLALNTWNALKRSAKGGPRRVDLAQEEIEALLGGRKLTIIAFFLDETFEDITYNMATTVSDAVEVILIFFTKQKKSSRARVPFICGVYRGFSWPVFCKAYSCLY